MAGKFCVFCGEQPESKNREHVIPAWLIALTGEKSREANLGLDFTSVPLEQRRYALDSFTFPACASCNSAFGELESQAKGVVETILRRAALAEDDWQVFLDWLDKVRVGLWLGGIYLNKNYQGVEPMFHIQNRMGASDRFVVIYELEDDGWRGLTWAGTDSPVFHVMPSCFSITINNFCFINVSCDFLLSERIGFPYPSSRRLAEDGLQYVTLSPGTGHVVLPPYDYEFRSGSRQLWQPMIPWRLTTALGEHSARLYDVDFVRTHCRDFEQGTGKILLRTKGGLTEYKPAPSRDWLPPYTRPRRDTVYRASLAAHEILGRLYSAYPSLDDLPDNERRKVRHGIELRLQANQAQCRSIEDTRNRRA